MSKLVERPPRVEPKWEGDQLHGDKLETQGPIRLVNVVHAEDERYDEGVNSMQRRDELHRRTRREGNR